MHFFVSARAATANPVLCSNFVMTATCMWAAFDWGFRDRSGERKQKAPLHVHFELRQGLQPPLPVPVPSMCRSGFGGRQSWPTLPPRTRCSSSGFRGLLSLAEMGVGQWVGRRSPGMVAGAVTGRAGAAGFPQLPPAQSHSPALPSRPPSPFPLQITFGPGEKRGRMASFLSLPPSEPFLYQLVRQACFRERRVRNL